MALKLSYCQLIRIILSQIGGSRIGPSLLTQIAGAPAIIQSKGIIPKELQELKQFADQITAAVKVLGNYLNDLENIVDDIQTQFFQNPANVAINAAITAVNAKIAAETPGSAEEIALQAYKTTLLAFQANTNVLSGVTKASPVGGGPGDCSIMDILGDVCDPNSSDLDLVTINQLLDGLRKGDVIQALTNKIAAATGVTTLLGEISNLQTQLNQFNTTFRVTINTKVIKNAVTTQINNIVYNLLSGCGNNILNLTLKETVKDKLAPYIALLEAQQLEAGVLANTYTDPITGNVVVAVT